MQHFTLNNQKKIPVIGFGTWQINDADAQDAVYHALKSGYQHIDTAAIYRNELGVGLGLSKFLQEGNKREDLFITTKLWNDSHSYKKALIAIDQSLKKLKLEYLDLYLIHWPNPFQHRDNWESTNAECYAAMEDAVKSGKLLSIGVSNFYERHFEALFKTCKIIPQVNQIYANPSDPQHAMRDFHSKHNILTQAYSPLGHGGLLDNQVLQTIAKQHNKNTAQILIKWCLVNDMLPLPKTNNKDRAKDNINVFDFTLTDDNLAQIDKLQNIIGQAKNPDTVDF